MQTGIWLIDFWTWQVIYSDRTWPSLARAAVWYLLFFAALCLPVLRITGRRFALHHPRALALGSLILAIAISSLWLWPLTRIEWGLTDDHEWLDYLDADNHFTTPSLLSGIRNHAELAGCFKPEKNIARFRPAYYLTKYLELWFWNGNSHGFGLDRLIYFTFFLWATQRTLQNFTDPLFAWLVTLSLPLFSSGVDIWTRLGPSEAQAAVGLALFGIGFSQLWISPRKFQSLPLWKASLPWFWIALGASFSLLSKENFIVIMIPWGLLLLRELWTRRRIPWPGRLANIGLFAAAFGLVAVLKWKLNLMRNRTIYGTSVQTTTLATLLFQGLTTFLTSWQGLVSLVATAVMILLILIAAARSKISSPTSRRMLFDILLTWTLAAAFYLSQYVFYAGEIDAQSTNARYRFPAEFSWYLALAFLAYRLTGNHYLRECTTSRGRLRWWRLAFLAAFIPGIVLGPHSFAALTFERIEKTRLTHDYFQRLATLCRENPDRPLIVETTHPSFYEQALLGIPSQLRYAHITNPRFLVFDGQGQNANLHLYDKFKGLGVKLQETSHDGGFGFRPLKELSESGPQPLIISVDATQTKTSGQSFGTVPWR